MSAMIRPAARNTLPRRWCKQRPKDRQPFSSDICSVSNAKAPKEILFRLLRIDKSRALGAIAIERRVEVGREGVVAANVMKPRRTAVCTENLIQRRLRLWP